MTKIIFSSTLFVGLTVIINILLTIPVFSQEYGSWTSFTTEYGLPHNDVYAILESKDGPMWFGTPNGACQYYEGNWNYFNKKNGLVSNSVKSIIETENGKLWFAGYNGVSSYYNGQWNSYTNANGLVDNWVNTIFESKDGTIWIGTNGGVNYYKNGIWESITSNDGLVNNRVNAICQSNDDAIWFGTMEGVSRLKDGSWTSYFKDDGLAGNDVRYIMTTKNNAIWFGIWGGGVSCYYNNTWKSYTYLDCEIINNVGVIVEASNGALWLGTPYGVAILHNNDWTILTTDDGLTKNRILSMIESNDGAMWFGTSDGGVNRFQNSIWKTYTEDDGLTHNQVYTAIQAKDGSFWFGTGSGINFIKNQTWGTFKVEDGLVSNQVRTIIESEDGAIWFGTNKGVSRYLNGVWTTFTEDDGLAYNGILSIAEATDGSIWFGTNGAGVSRYKNGEWKTYTKVDGLIDNVVYAILGLNNGGLMFGTMGGVSNYKDSQWTSYTIRDGLISNLIKDMVEAADSSLWFGTSNGISHLKNSRWNNYSSSDGLAFDHVISVLESEDGALWFGTRGGGVSRYQDKHWATFTTSDKLANNLVWDIIESKDGMLWFATDDNISRLKPDKIPPYTLINKAPSGIIGTQTPMFIYSGKDFITELENLEYAHEIVNEMGFTVDGDSTLYSSETAIQPIIPSNGTYTFKVWARDEWGNVDQSPATRSFFVDITQPTVTITNPKQGQNIRGDFLVIGFAFDNSPTKDFKNYGLFYGNYVSQDQMPIWNNSLFTYLRESIVEDDTLGIFETSNLIDGLYQIKLWAIDTLKHESEDIVLITIDNTDPSIKITNPSTNDTITGEITIQVTINEVNLDRYSLQYRMDFQTEWYEITQDSLPQLIGNSLNYLWTNTSDSGNTNIKLTAFDKAGNFSSDSVMFLLNNAKPVKPVASLTSPLSNSYINGLLPIRGTATDNEFTHFSLFLEDQNIKSDTLVFENNMRKTNEELYSLDTRNYSDGKYKLFLDVLNDKLYHNQKAVTFFIDNTPPIARLTSPSSGDTLKFTVNIEGIATDNNLKEMTLKYAKMEETDSSKFIFLDKAFSEWNTIDCKGFYNLYLTVEDLGGLKSKSQQFYFIDNPIFSINNSLSINHKEVNLFLPPNGYLPSTICIVKKNIKDYGCDSTQIIPSGLLFELQSNLEVKKLNKKGVLTFDYKNLNLTNINENKLQIFNYKNNRWSLVGGTPVISEKKVLTAIDTLGIYGLFENKIELDPFEKELEIACEPRVFSPNGNGFDTKTAIIFELGKTENVTILVFNTAGRMIRELSRDEQLPVGRIVIDWDGKDNEGNICTTGLYIITVQISKKIDRKTVAIANK